MKRLFAFLFVLLLPMMAMGANVKYRQWTDAEKQNANPLVEELIDVLNGAFRQFPQYQYMDDECDFECQGRVNRFNDHDRNNLILAFGAEKLMRQIIDEFVKFANQKAQETGRELKETLHNKQPDGTALSGFYELDWGEIGSEECMKKFGSDEQCLYPDDFEDIALEFEFKPTKDDKQFYCEISMFTEDKKTNKKTGVMLVMESENDKGPNESMYQLTVNVIGTEERFDEYAWWRNQHIQDMKDGIYIRVNGKGKTISGKRRLHRRGAWVVANGQKPTPMPPVSVMSNFWQYVDSCSDTGGNCMKSEKNTEQLTSEDLIVKE